MFKTKNFISNRKLYIVTDDAPFLTTNPLPTPPPPPPPPHLLTMDSSMVLVILVLSTALVSVIFFCFYLCRPNPDSTATRNASPREATSRKGLDPASVPVSCYGGVEAASRNVECAICLGEFGENDDVKVMPFCKHVFHPGCIDTWLSSHVTCPVCRSTRCLEGAEEERR